MAAFQKVALLQSCHAVPPTHEYYISDMIEVSGLAAVIRDQVSEVSLPVSPLDRNADGVFERFMKKRRPDLVGISTFTCGVKSAYRQAEIAKRYGATVLMGGYHPTARPDELLQSGLVDVVIRGEGELTFEEFVRTGSTAGVDGISYMEDGKCIHNPDRGLIMDLDTVPLPLRELRPHRFGLSGRNYHTDTIFTSRGCPARCTFCANNLVGKQWRKRSISSILEELQLIPMPAKKDWKFIKLWDSNFLTELERIEELCDGIIELGLQRHFRFLAETRASDIVRGGYLLPRMREAGFVRMGCGVESPSKETRKRLKKGLDITHVDKAAKLLTDSEIQLTKFLIVGHPGESEEDIQDYVKYSLDQGVRLQNTTFFVLTPYPGTVLGEQYFKDGLVRSVDWDLYTNMCAVVSPEGMDTQKMQSLYCSVALRYGAHRRFLRKGSFWSTVSKVLEVLLANARVGSSHPLHSTADVEEGLMQAIFSAASSCQRPIDAAKPPTFADSVALRVHARDGRSARLSMERVGQKERLVIEDGQGSARAFAKEVHIYMPHLVRLVQTLPHVRGASDINTLKWNWRAFKLRWAPSLAWELLKLGGWMGRMSAYQVKQLLLPGGTHATPAAVNPEALERQYQLPRLEAEKAEVQQAASETQQADHTQV